MTPVVKQGQLNGSLDAKTTAVTGGTSYMWRISLLSAPNTFVQLHPSTAASYSLEGLTSGQIYLVQVCVLSAAGVSEWSTPGQRMVI